MNYIQAQAIANLYQELIESIPKTNLNLPSTSYVPWSHNDIEFISLDGEQVKAHFAKYRGCGEYDEAVTYTNLEKVFD